MRNIEHEKLIARGYSPSEAALYVEARELREVTEQQSRALMALRDRNVALGDQLRGAVGALREWLAADDDAERDFTDESEARLAEAIRVARTIVGEQ